MPALAFARILRQGSTLALLASCLPAFASLSYSNWTRVYGYVHTEYQSPYLGAVSFNVNGPDYSTSWSPATPAPLNAASFTIAPNQAPGVDPIYDIVTGSGAYGFGYDGQAQVVGTQLHAQISTSQIDASMNPVNWTPSSSVQAYSEASWSQEMLIAPTAARPAGSYGAILVGITLDGPAPTSDNWAYGQLYTYASFMDTAGVSYSSSFGVSTAPNDPDWTGSVTVYKKLLIQYGTPFTLSTYLWTSANGNSTVDFMNTGKISSIEIPYGATLQSGAADAGLGSDSELYGSVYNSASVDDQNTNWDFGNNGGGFTPPVPEPGGGLLLAAGLAVIGWKLRRGLSK